MRQDERIKVHPVVRPIQGASRLGPHFWAHWMRTMAAAKHSGALMRFCEWSFRSGEHRPTNRRSRPPRKAGHFARSSPNRVGTAKCGAVTLRYEVGRMGDVWVIACRGLALAPRQARVFGRAV